MNALNNSKIAPSGVSGKNPLNRLTPIMLLQLAMIVGFCASGQTIPAPGNLYIPFHQLLKQQNNLAQIRTISTAALDYKQIAYLQQTWDLSQVEFTPSDSGMFVYSDKGLATSNTSYSYTTGKWGGYNKLTYTYDGSGNQLVYLNQYWDNNSATWINVSLFTNTYDGSNNMLTALTQTWDVVAAGWANVQNYSYAYDANGNKIQQATQTWDVVNNVWANSYQTINTYDVNNHLTAMVNQITTIAGTWCNTGQTLNTYNGTGSLLAQTTQTWNDSNWINNSVVLNTYNAANGLTSTLAQFWQNGAWLNATMTNTTFDANNNQTQQSGLLWSAQNNAWDPTSRNTYTYNAANKILSETDQLNSPAGYVNMNQYIYTYDNKNNNTEYQSFQTVGNAWSPMAVYQYTFDQNNNAVTEQSELYSLQTASFEPQNQYTFYYQAFDSTAPTSTTTTSSSTTAINTVTKNDFAATLYPNPSNGSAVNLNLNSGTSASIVMNVYDISGTVVSSGFISAESGSQRIELGGAALANGTYYVQLTDRDGGKTSVLPFVKQ